MIVMKLSMKWLKDYVNINVTPQEYANAMTMSGSKVEGYEVEGSSIENVVVGKILSISKHPDADKLLVCSVDVARAEPLQVVTAATNINPGDLVPVALDGAVLANGTTIKSGKLRGVESQGMLCSISELGLTLNDFPEAASDGIFILEQDCQPGQSIQEAIGLNDTVVEFEITSNRPDCFSVIGLARETAATFNLPLTLHEPKIKGGISSADTRLEVDIKDKDLCSRYIAKVVKNARIAPSPRWMRERLRASGIRPINNIVDITNYVMLEYGQPLHAFDYRFIEGSKINVRRAVKGETITTLDGEVRELDQTMLVIADERKPIAVAGIMGGEYSGVMDDTKTIVFESACFFGPSVRVTAKKLGMRTDSSSRFEKGLSAQNCLPAIIRACELVEMLDAGDVCDEIIDCDYSDKSARYIDFDANWINSFLGTDIAPQDMKDYLSRLGFEVERYKIKVPHFRTDIENKYDISEEIARLYGYDNIPITQLRGVAEGKRTHEQKFESLVASVLLAQGLSEIMTYSFISPKQYDKILMPKDSPLRDSVVISNPLGEDMSIMRTTALPSMLEILSRNYNNRNSYAWLFELATEYINKGLNELPDENKKVVIGMYGNNADFYTLKGIVEQLLDSACIADYDMQADDKQYAYHPERCAVVTAKGTQIGVLGELHPTVCENFEIDQRVYAAELDFNAMLCAAKAEKKYKTLPKFPSVTRDLALICDISLAVGEIRKVIKAAAGDILENIELFDIYTGQQIPQGKKSVAYSLTLRSDKATLTDKEVDKVINNIILALSQINVEIRA